MNRSNQTYISLHSDEKETLKEALRTDYSEEGRISLGAYARTLAEKRLQEVRGDE